MNRKNPYEKPVPTKKELQGWVSNLQIEMELFEQARIRDNQYLIDRAESAEALLRRVLALPAMQSLFADESDAGLLLAVGHHLTKYTR